MKIISTKVIAEQAEDISSLIQDDLPRLHKLFWIIKAYVLASGGDGDGWIISEQFKSLADKFEEYEKNNDSWFTSRNDWEDCVVFSANQESIHFVDPGYQLPEWAGDIVVRSIQLG